MSKQEITETVENVIAKQFDIDKSKVTPHLNFQKDLDADSIDFVELIMALDNKFNVKTPDNISDKLKTVQDAVNYIYNQKNK